MSSDVAHETAIDSMDILGKLLNDKITHTEVTYDLNNIGNILNSDKIPILLCSKILKENEPFEHSWDVSSDSISAYISNVLNANLLIVTNVDGIYTRKPELEGSKFISKIDAKKLLSFEETSIDLKLPSLLLEFGTNCYIVNGKFPERVLSIIEDSTRDYSFNYTYIKGD